MRIGGSETGVRKTNFSPFDVALGGKTGGNNKTRDLSHRGIFRRFDKGEVKPLAFAPFGVGVEFLEDMRGGFLGCDFLNGAHGLRVARWNDKVRFDFGGRESVPGGSNENVVDFIVGAKVLGSADENEKKRGFPVVVIGNAFR